MNHHLGTEFPAVARLILWTKHRAAPPQANCSGLYAWQSKLGHLSFEHICRRAPGLLFARRREPEAYCRHERRQEIAEGILLTKEESTRVEPGPLTWKAELAPDQYPRWIRSGRLLASPTPPAGRGRPSRLATIGSRHDAACPQSTLRLTSASIKSPSPIDQDSS